METSQLAGGSLARKGAALVALAVLLVLGLGISGTIGATDVLRAIPAFIVIGAVIVLTL
jgi:hypothetical protein